MILFAAVRGLNSSDTKGAEFFGKKIDKILAEIGSKMFGELNQKSGYIRISGIKSSNSCKDNQGKILVLAEVTSL